MQHEELFSRSLFDFSHTRARELFDKFPYPWEVLPHIFEQISIISKNIEISFREISAGVFVHETAEIAPTARLCAPCIICAHAEVRQGAFLRGGVLVGEDCVVGNCVELKNCILFDGVHIPHLSYVGDSVLGYKAHLGAGAIVSNLRLDNRPVSIRLGTERIGTGLRKCGAFLGDGVEVGCNAVLSPGTVLGRRACVYPLVSVCGAYPAGSIIKG